MVVNKGDYMVPTEEVDNIIDAAYKMGIKTALEVLKIELKYGSSSETMVKSIEELLKETKVL
jgi:hypothetical protein